ncbi:peptide methionine sulfoxide reductase MsrA [Pelagophyceae sp. CCMP2097]|nr:peptide methionine sulfoxide reductase MsrA [Pelagophyceae sp. CCMP2097]
MWIVAALSAAPASALAPRSVKTMTIGSGEYNFDVARGLYKLTGGDGPTWIDLEKSQERLWEDKGYGFVDKFGDGEAAEDYVGDGQLYKPAFQASNGGPRISSLGYDLAAAFDFGEMPEMSRRVLYEGATEPPFTGISADGHSFSDWANAPEGVVFLCAASGLPAKRSVFSAAEAYDSMSGWPAFTRPIADDHVVLRPDGANGDEVLCARSLTHLGHLIADGANKRYCINAAALTLAKNLDAPSRPVALPLAELPKALSEALQMSRSLQIAQFATGCYWNAQLLWSRVPGVFRTSAGTWAGEGEAVECVRFEYDAGIVSYEDLCRLFFASHDPSSRRAQGEKATGKYRTEVHALCEDQFSTAMRVLQEVKSEAMEPLATRVVRAAAPPDAFAPAALEAAGFLPATDQHFLRDARKRDASKLALASLAKLPNKLED